MDSMELYGKKNVAETYVGGNFFAGMTLDQQSESMNSTLKKHMEYQYRMYELIMHLNRSLTEVRHKEAHNDHNTHQMDPFTLTHLKEIERQITTLNTRSLF